MAQGAYEARCATQSSASNSASRSRSFRRFSSSWRTWPREIEAARLLTYRAAWLADRAIAPATTRARFTRESSMAKLYAGEVAVRVANEAVQIHGGYGFIKDYPVEKFYRDVKLCTIGEGTSEIQRMVIAREILGKLISRRLHTLVCPPSRVCAFRYVQAQASMVKFWP